MKEFCDNTDFFDFTEILSFLPKRGWPLLNLALWWRQYIGAAAAAQRDLSGTVPSATQPVNLRCILMPIERGA